MLKRDYRKLYQLQDKFLDIWKTIETPFYLTGGTALGKYYLNHRYSEDLDFFVNGDKNFKQHINLISNTIKKYFLVDNDKSLQYDDFTRIYIQEDKISMKIEFVNDLPYRTGKTKAIFFGEIDTPHNILSNKLSALINRDEPKDIFDIVHLSLNYKFKWPDIFSEVKEKEIINEIDIEQKINNFPVALLDGIDWFIQQPDYDVFTKHIKQIANDFITGSDNSICQTNICIEDAEVITG
jgi:predicted nucleotidyltransferase component of viral defense system